MDKYNDINEISKELIDLEKMDWWGEYFSKYGYKIVSTFDVKNKIHLEIAKIAVSKSSIATFFLSEDFKQNKEIRQIAIESDGGSILHFTECLNDKEMVLLALKTKGTIYPCISDNLKNDKEVILAAIKRLGGNYFEIPEKFKNNKEIILESSLEILSKEQIDSDLIKDEDVMAHLISNNIRNVKIIDKSLIGNKKIIKKLINSKMYLEEESWIYSDKEYVKFLSHGNDSVKLLRFLGKDLKEDIEFIKDLMKSTHDVYYWLSISIKHNKEIALIDYKNKTNIYRIPEKLLEDKEFIINILSENILELSKMEKFNRDKEILYMFEKEIRVFDTYLSDEIDMLDKYKREDELLSKLDSKETIFHKKKI